MQTLLYEQLISWRDDYPFPAEFECDDNYNMGDEELMQYTYSKENTKKELNHKQRLHNEWKQTSLYKIQKMGMRNTTQRLRDGE